VFELLAELDWRPSLPLGIARSARTNAHISPSELVVDLYVQAAGEIFKKNFLTRGRQNRSSPVFSDCSSSALVEFFGGTGSGGTHSR